MRIQCVVCALLILFVGVAASQRRKAEVEGPFPVNAGETCVVCYGAVSVSGLAYLVNGHRYAVDKAEASDFLDDPEPYIERYDQRRSMQQRRMMLGVGLGAAAVAAIGALWIRRRRAAGPLAK